MLDSFQTKVLSAITAPIVKSLWIDRVIGKDNIPTKGPCIVIANHTSYLDFIILGTVFKAMCGHNLYFWANLKVVNHPIFKYYARCYESIAVDVNKPTMAFWKKSLEYIANGKFIGIFPEGTRSRTGGLLKFNPGYLKLASRTGAPILPVIIKNAYNILPADKKVPNLREKCTVNIHPLAILPENIDKEGLKHENKEIFQKYFEMNCN